MSNTGTERRLLSRAQDLAETGDLAETITAILAGARRARLDPDALGGLVAAALALEASTTSVFRAGDGAGPAIRDEREFAERVSGAEDDIGERLEEARRLQRDVRSARNDAVRDLASARRDLARAKSMGTSKPCDGCHEAKAAAIAAAEQEIRDCQDRIETCDEALEILLPLIRRLLHALARIRQVPSDLGEAYESVYNLIRRGRVMPHDGDFISGDSAAR